MTTARLVDTHCHLTDPRFAEDREAVVARALEAGLTHIVAVGGGGPIEASEEALALARKYPFVKSTAGMHPHDADGFDDATEARVAALLAQDGGASLAYSAVKLVVAALEAGADLSTLAGPDAP